MKNMKFWEFLLKTFFVFARRPLLHFSEVSAFSYVWWGKILSSSPLHLIISWEKTFIKVHATMWFHRKSHFESEPCWFKYLLCHLLQMTSEKLNSSIRMLSETTSGLLQSSGNLLFHSRSRGRLAPGLVNSVAQFLVSFWCARLLLGSSSSSGSLLKLVHIHTLWCSEKVRNLWTGCQAVSFPFWWGISAHI